MVGAELTVRTCRCGDEFAPAGASGLRPCLHCDAPCSRKGCARCRRQLRTPLPDGAADPQ